MMSVKSCVLLLLPFLVLSCTNAPNCHYKGAFTQEANAGCLVVHDNKILFVEGNNQQLALPGGGLASNEAPQCTAEREAFEETGIEVIAGERLITFDNGFQLFRCHAIDNQKMDGSNRPWRFETVAIHWLTTDEFEGKTWRFPEQVTIIKKLLEP